MLLRVRDAVAPLKGGSFRPLAKGSTAGQAKEMEGWGRLDRADLSSEAVNTQVPLHQVGELVSEEGNMAHPPPGVPCPHFASSNGQASPLFHAIEWFILEIGADMDD